MRSIVFTLHQPTGENHRPQVQVELLQFSSGATHEAAAWRWTRLNWSKTERTHAHAHTCTHAGLGVEVNNSRWLSGRQDSADGIKRRDGKHARKRTHARSFQPREINEAIHSLCCVSLRDGSSRPADKRNVQRLEPVWFWPIGSRTTWALLLWKTNKQTNIKQSDDPSGCLCTFYVYKHLFGKVTRKVGNRNKPLIYPSIHLSLSPASILASSLVPVVATEYWWTSCLCSCMPPLWLTELLFPLRNLISLETTTAEKDQRS